VVCVCVQGMCECTDQLCCVCVCEGYVSVQMRWCVCVCVCVEGVCECTDQIWCVCVCVCVEGVCECTDQMVCVSVCVCVYVKGYASV